MVQQSGKLCTERRRGKILHRAACCCYKIVRMGEDKEVSCCEWQIGKFVLWVWSLSLKEELNKTGLGHIRQTRQQRDANAIYQPVPTRSDDIHRQKNLVKRGK